MEQDTEKTKVIFRKFKDGDIIALFPQLPGTNNYFADMSSYQHIGQHGSATTRINEVTTPATPEEYANLKEELESIGYNLIIGKHVTYADFVKRRTAARGY